LVSACLLGEKCRYDGKGYLLPSLVTSLQGYKVLPICPEVMGGLSVPRPPCEIKGGDGMKVWQGTAGVFTEQGQDLTEVFQKGAYKTLKLAVTTGAQTAILKEKSPSCGCYTIYDGSFCNCLIPGVGVTTALLKKNKIQVVTHTEWLEKRRDHFD